MPSAKPASNRLRFVRVAVFGALLAVALAAGAIWLAYRTLGASLPSLSKLEQNAGPVGGTLVFGARGDTLMSFYRERRVNVPLADVPDDLEKAVLSVEDWRFYRHWGVDLQGLARALAANVLHGKRQGASTLTQQLARNISAERGSGPVLTHEQTLTRKVKEAMLALRIERTYTKDEILAMYLNQIYFGEGAHGVEAAARTYFSKPARDLDIAEAATLAGLPKNPNGYSPFDYPDRARRRRNVVLRTMLDHGILGRSQFETLAASPLVTHPSTEARPVAAYFTEEVRKYLEDQFGAEALYSGELRVFTTLDLPLQLAAEAAIETRFREIETSLGLPFKRQDYEAARRRGENIEPRYLQGALVALDPHTGRILSLVGGRSFAESRFNRATQAKRQPGSCFKPFVYLTGVRKGLGPSEIFLDTPLVVDMGGGRGLWKPQNYSQTFSGPVSLRTSLAKSLNVPSIKLLQQVGVENVIETAHAVGIESPLQPVLSLALGVSETNLLELTGAYGTLANGGITSRPYFIERVEDRTGRVLKRATEFHAEAVDPQSAYVLTSMLRSVIDWGTGHNARDLYAFTAPAAGKTGTTDDLGDGWFVGYTPDLVVGVWGGFDERRPIGLAGSYIALPPWCDVLKWWTARNPVRDFPEPAGIVQERVCADSGKLATPACPRVQTEICTDRTRPTRECDLHSGGVSERATDPGLEDPNAQPHDLAPPGSTPPPPPDQ